MSKAPWHRQTEKFPFPASWYWDEYWHLEGLTYFFLDRQALAVKIGCTGSNVAKRLAALQIGNPRPLESLGAVRGAALETYFHNAFADSRIRGEWFSYSPGLTEAIQWGKEADQLGSVTMQYRFQATNIEWTDWTQLKRALEAELQSVSFPELGRLALEYVAEAVTFAGPSHYKVA